MDFDKSNSKLSINYFLEDFRIQIKIPLKSEDIDENSIILLNRVDFSNKIYLASIN